MKNPFDNNSDTSDFVVAAPAAQGSGHVNGGGAPPAPVLGAPIDITDETREAEASFAASGDGGPGSVVAVGGPASAGLTINLIFDAAAMAAPQSFRDGITQAMQMICAVVTDHVTLNLQIDYSGTGGGASAGPTGGNFVNYSTVHADLVNNASPGDTTFNSLPAGSTIAGQSSVAVWYSQEKLWGMISPTGTEVDGSAKFSTDINPNLLVGVALHELTHAMGRVPYGSQPDVFDFYRFTSAGNYLLNGNSTAPPAYFSLNNGVTKIADYGQTSDPSDFLNSGLAGPTDPFNEFYSNSTQQQLTAIDLMQIDALGFHLLSNTPQTVIEQAGATKLVEISNDYYFYPVAGGTGPELMYGGTPWAAGQAWAPIGVEQTSTGYEVALLNASTHLFTIWNTDSSGNVLTASISGVSGTNTALESIETSFQQDLNGDGTIGIPVATGTTIEAFGATKLVQVGNDYFFNPVAGGSGPELMYGGAPWAAGQAWAPIGVEKTSSGYEVALFNASSHLYTIWNTDSSGNVLAASLSNASGTSTALEAAEVSFQQDLNGDHIIGVPSGPPPSSTTIEAFGVTALVQTGNDYFFNPVAGGSGPELTYSGTPWAAGQAWAPIGVEKTSTGYEVALFNASSQLYTVWNTDSSGNVLSASISGVAGTNTALESIETSFQQDLNGDNVIGIPGHTSPSAQVASAAPAAPASFSGGDTFTFRADLGSASAANAPPSAASPAAGEMLTLTTASAPMAHIDLVDAHDLGGTHDATVHSTVFDPLHGFILH